MLDILQTCCRRIHSMVGGYVFPGVCLLTWGIPHPGQGGYPRSKWVPPAKVDSPS